LVKEYAKQETDSKQVGLVAGFLLSLLFIIPEGGGNMFL
jgi:hypothetical protein